MSEACKCGHDERDHQDTCRAVINASKAVTQFCACMQYTPAAAPEQAAPAWLDKPDGDGLWWGGFGGATNCYMVVSSKCYLHGESHTNATPLDRMPAGWWTRVQPAPTPPAPPLPKSRTVTLTAKVQFVPGPKEWEVVVLCDRYGLWSWRDVSKQVVLEMARARYGIEPKVSEP